MSRRGVKSKKRLAYISIILLMVVLVSFFVSKFVIKDFQEFFGFESGGKEKALEKSEIEEERLLLAPAGGWEVAFESASLKVRQDYIFPLSQWDWQIKSARNEFEPFQLVLKTDAPKQNIDVEITDFQGPGIIDNGNVTIFWEGYVNVTTISSPDGGYGEWPDILVPKVDAYYHEQRNFFPFGLNASRVQPIWFDVFVPKNTAPGNYIANVNVSENGASIFYGSVNLEVWDFELPATSTLINNFILSGDSLWKGYYYPNPPLWETNIVELMRIYNRAGLRHRLTFSPRSIQFGLWNNTILDYENISQWTQSKINPANFNKTLEGFVGAGDPQVEYGDSKFTMISGSLSSVYMKHVNWTYGGYYNVTRGVWVSNCTDAPSDALYSFVVQVKKTSELLASILTPEQEAIYYMLPLDEPGAGEIGCGLLNQELDYNTSIASAQEIKAVGLKTFVTRTRKIELLNQSVVPPRNDYWNMWVAMFNYVVGRNWTTPFYNNRPIYNDDISNGTGLIWYQGCETHGCDGVLRNSSVGYPQYGMDYSALHARIFPWMTFKYDVQGEFYYASVLDLTDPWYSQWYSSYFTNGEGNFFYPGLVNATQNGFSPITPYGKNTPSIGGVHDIPIESIRLKMMREGYEDYEYFYKLKQIGGEASAKAEVDKIVVNTFNFSMNPIELYDSRENVAQAILQLQGTGYCGDSICNSTIGEDCSSCALDCGACSDVTAPVRDNGMPSGILPIGTTSANMNLTTDETAECRYSVSAGINYNSMINSMLGIGNLHYSVLSGLTPGNYSYYVRCNDSFGNYNTNDYLISFNISGSGTVPVISSIFNGSITNNSAIISWQTDVNADSRVYYGLTLALNNSVLNYNYLISHIVQLNNLIANRTYYYKIWGCDSVGNCANSSTYNFKTLKANETYIDNEAPIILLNNPADTESLGSNIVAFNYSVSDYSAIPNCSVYIGVEKRIDFDIENNVANVFVLSLANGDYSWNVSCVDLFGNVGESETRSLNVNYVAPVEPPSDGGGGEGGGSLPPPIKPKPVVENVTDIPPEIDEKEKIILGDELSFIDVGWEGGEFILVDLYGNTYLASFILTDDGEILAKLLNGDYIIPRDDVLEIGLGDSKVYAGVIDGDAGARVVLGLNGNSVRDKIVGESGTDGGRKNLGIYYTLIAIVVIFIVGIIALIIWYLKKTEVEQTQTDELAKVERIKIKKNPRFNRHY